MSSLIHAISKHIAGSGQSESAFGEAAAGDKALIRTIRAGRELRPETEIRVWRYLETHRPKSTFDACACGGRKRIGMSSCYSCREASYRYDPQGPAEAAKPTAAFKGKACPLAKRINHLAVTAAFEAGFDEDPVIGWHLLEGHSAAAIRARLQAIGEGLGG